MKITRKAYAKINLCLDVLRRRPDGYHDVKMIMQTVDIYDTLTFETKENADSLITLNMGENEYNADLGPTEDNLIYKTASLIMDKYALKVPVVITLDKRIPVAAGMAGGSSDAAAVFHGLNELFGLNMSIDEMSKMAVSIGADVPYCLIGGTALSEGIGERLTSINNPPQCSLLIAKPDINVSTKYVYENLHVDTIAKHPNVDAMITAIDNENLSEVADLLDNILENVTVIKYPIIENIKSVMKNGGALNALMSGSGPTVFGIFDDENMAHKCKEAIIELKLAKEVFVTKFI